MLLLTYLLLSNFVDNEEKRRQYYLRKDLNKKALPLRFQAFERLTVFLERITPNQLVTRVKPGNMPLSVYRKTLVDAIRQEYEYNISQQVYISDKIWNNIVSAKSQVVVYLLAEPRHVAAPPGEAGRERLVFALRLLAALRSGPCGAALDSFRRGRRCWSKRS